MEEFELENLETAKISQSHTNNAAFLEIQKKQENKLIKLLSQ